MGSYATGITWNGPIVRMDYEISLDAMRVDGSDFFCALTFPVGENPCTLVLGGWGGTLCGLSNLDYYDASENETTTFYAFEKNTWYHVRLRVIPGADSGVARWRAIDRCEYEGSQDRHSRRDGSVSTAGGRDVDHDRRRPQYPIEETARGDGILSCHVSRSSLSRSVSAEMPAI